jgi:hypothetical protein
MYAHTSEYVRTDGSRRRTYVCGNVDLGTGLCDAPPVNAEVVDALILQRLDELTPDLERWSAELEQRRTGEYERVADELRRAEVDHAEQTRRVEAVQRKWASYVSEGDDAKADLVLGAVEREQDALRRSERRLEATRDALATIPPSSSEGAATAVIEALREVVRGRIEAANGSMAALNGALRELFTAFMLGETAWAGHEGGGYVFDHPTRRAVYVQPILDPDVATQALGEHWPTLISAEDARDALDGIPTEPPARIRRTAPRRCVSD